MTMLHHVFSKNILSTPEHGGKFTEKKPSQILGVRMSGNRKKIHVFLCVLHSD